jgi:CrcB protein
MTQLLLIAAGGALGAVARFLVAGWGQRLIDGPFPLGTLLVNLVGCVLIGFLATALSGPILLREELRLALLVGLLGGFTTFSSFGYETLALLQDGQVRAAALNVVLNNGLGLLAVWGGVRIALRWPGV